MGTLENHEKLFLASIIEEQYDSLTNILCDPNIKDKPELKMVRDMGIPFSDVDEELIFSLNELMSLSSGKISLDELELVNCMGLLYILSHHDSNSPVKDNLIMKIGNVLNNYIKRELDEND